MLISPERYSLKLCFLLFITAFILHGELFAQTKKTVKGKPAAAKKTEKTARDAKKEASAKKDSAKKPDSKKEKSNSKESSRQEKAKLAESNRKDARKAKDAASAKETQKEKAAQKARDAQRAREEKRLAEIRQAEEARRRAAEEARRQAILAEKRRREQAAREARARRLAFERGLYTETVENIVSDNTEGEDLQIRRAAISALGKHAGTAVVMEAQTGRILTIVNQDWAVRNSYRPCSTIKLVTGVAGLNERVIDAEGGIGNFRMNLDDALAFSNNVYFQKVGLNIGNNKIISYARALGLGEPTGINFAGETAGKLPYNNGNARIYSHGDDFEVSPLQLAVMVSAISNGGRIVVPQIPRTRVEQTKFRGYLRRQVNLPNSSVVGVIPGMIGAAQYGTARRGVDSSLGIAGKTGSCIGKGSWLGLFASVAPVGNPKYAVVVITRGQAERGKYAAAVAGRIYEELAPRLRERDDKNLALIPQTLKPKSQIDEKTSAQLGGGEDEDEKAEKGIDVDDLIADEDDEEIVRAPANVRRPIIVRPTPKPPTKLVQKTGAVFPPVVIKVKKRPGETETTRPRIVINK